MGRGEAGFSLLEMIVAVGVTVILLAVGGFWLLSMRPGALRGALDDFDANLASAKAIAATSGNGATLIFEPKADGSAGFTLSVYSGRPNAAGAVKTTNTMIANSGATVKEAHFGNPPFAIFLSSAGYPTGKAGYPTLSSGTPNFTTIATQPPCPAGGIELTFTSPQGVTATRTLPCDVIVAGTSAATVIPTPLPPKIEPTTLLAHWTTDTGPLKFKAVEYGYFHWYDIPTGTGCNGSSDTGNPAAYFPNGSWPFAQPQHPSELNAAPAVPGVPYTWPNGDPNDPPASFQLSTTQHNGGFCSLTVADDYGRSGSVQVQVMGDLTPSTNALTLTMGQPSQTVFLHKTFDTDPLTLAPGGHCATIITASSTAGTPPPNPTTPSNTPVTGSVTVSPIAQGSCTMVVGDQYGEPLVPIAINVLPPPTPTPVPWQNFGTWPASLVLGAAGRAVGYTESAQLAYEAPQSILARVAPVLNTLLGGGIARAQSSIYTGACYAQAFKSGTSGPIDMPLPSGAATLDVSVTTDGCILNAAGNQPFGGSSAPTGAIVGYEPFGSGQLGNFQPTSQCSNAANGSWIPNLGRNDADALLPMAGVTTGSCNVDISDGTSTQAPAPDAGQIAVSVVSVATMEVECTGFIDQEGDRGCTVACQGNAGGCVNGGQGIDFPCPPAGLGGGPFEITTSEGTGGGGYSISPGQEIEVSTSSDGTAFISATSC